MEMCFELFQYWKRIFFCGILECFRVDLWTVEWNWNLLEQRELQWYYSKWSLVEQGESLLILSQFRDFFELEILKTIKNLATTSTQSHLEFPRDSSKQYLMIAITNPIFFTTITSISHWKCVVGDLLLEINRHKKSKYFNWLLPAITVKVFAQNF